MIIEIHFRHRDYRELFRILGRIIYCRLELARLKFENRLFDALEENERDNYRETQ